MINCTKDWKKSKQAGEGGSDLNCLDDAGDVDVVEDGDDIGSKVGQRVEILY